MIIENIKLAIISLRANKLRALLTMLGIIIGVGSVIAIVTIGDAMTGNINSEWAGFGAKNISIQVSDRNSNNYDPSFDYSNYEWSEPKQSELITEKMVEDYRQKYLSSIEAITITNTLSTSRFTNGRYKVNAEVIGVNPDAKISDKIQMIAGEFITTNDILNKKKTIVVSDRFVQEYYGNRIDPKDAIGNTVILDKENKIEKLYISGVYRYQEQDGAMVYNKDSGTKAYIPYSLAYQIQDSSIGFKNLTVVPREEVDAKEFLISTSAYFESYYVSNEKITAVTSSMASMLKSMNKMLDQIKLGIGGVAAISLLVGGIGVMNIMMVSVTERTREIGIRMALGAKGSIIRFQFLVEAMMVSLCGGIIGIVMGLSIGAIVANVMKYQAKPSLFVILSSVLFSLAIGMFFGYMPANKASQLDPIEALRYE